MVGDTLSENLQVTTNSLRMETHLVSEHSGDKTFVAGDPLSENIPSPTGWLSVEADSISEHLEDNIFVAKATLSGHYSRFPLGGSTSKLTVWMKCWWQKTHSPEIF